MAKAIRLPRRTFWLGMATAVVVMTGADRAGAQEPRVATNASEDAQDNVAGILAALGAPSVAPDTAVIVPSTQRTPSSAPPLAPWVDVQTGTVATRFRYTETTTGAIVHDQQQLSEQFKARLKI